MSVIVDKFSLVNGDLSEEDIALEKKAFEDLVIKKYKLYAQEHLKDISCSGCRHRPDDYKGNPRKHYVNKIEMRGNEMVAICAFCGEFNPEPLGKSSGDWIHEFLRNEGFSFDGSSFIGGRKCDV
jgi:hypothetical protein